MTKTIAAYFHRIKKFLEIYNLAYLISTGHFRVANICESKMASLWLPNVVA